MIRLAATFAFCATTLSAETPSSIYLERYVGHYSFSRTCLGQEFVLSLMEERVNIGETGCTITDITRDGSGVAVGLSACQSEGDPSADRRIRVAPGLDGTILFGAPGEGGGEPLERCSDI